MTYVLVADATAKRLTGNPTLTRLDGEERCTFGSIRDSSPVRLAEFGVYDVDTAPPEGQQWTGQFDGTVTPPVAVFMDIDPEEARAAMPPITRRQLRLTLVRNGISLSDVTQALDAMPDGLAKEEAEIEWDTAGTYERLHPTLLTIADELSLTPEDVDDLWVKAMEA